jgi:hypothetical protein
MLKPIILHKINILRSERSSEEAASVRVFFTLQLNGTESLGHADLFHEGNYIEAFWSRLDTWLDQHTQIRLQALNWRDCTTVTTNLQTAVTEHILGRNSCDHFQSTHTTLSSYLPARA